MLGPSYGSYLSPTRNTPKKEASFQSKPGANVSQAISTRDTTAPEDLEIMGTYRLKENIPAHTATEAARKRQDSSLFTAQTQPTEGQNYLPSEIVNEIPQIGPEMRNVNMNITKKIGHLIERASNFSFEKEYSKQLVTDEVQWKLEVQKDIPDSFKQQINAYKACGDSALRLQRKVSGYHGVLCYILKNRLLVWFVSEDYTIEYDFTEPIQDVGNYNSSRIYFIASFNWNNRTATLIDKKIQLIENRQDIQGQFDGIYFERKSCRLFVMERGKQTLQEVIFSDQGESRKNEVDCVFGKLAGSRGPRLSSKSSFNPFQSLTEGFFSQNFNYRTHKFAFDFQRKLLFVLQFLWKGTIGFDDKIVSQNINIYNLEKGGFEGWGELKVESILQSANSQSKLSTQASAALREAKNNKITGISTSFGQPWNFSLMYDNGLQIRLVVLVSADNKSFNCLMHDFVGRRIETEAELAKKQFMDQNIHTAVPQPKLEGQPITTEYIGFENIQAIVHKQVIGRKVKLCVENNLNMVPAAAKYNTENQHILPAEKAFSPSLSTILKLDNYIEMMDSEIVFDSIQGTGPAAKLWEYHQNNPLFTNPLVRDIALSTLDQSDKLLVAYGNQICLYRRLRFSDVVYCIVYALDKAKRASNIERKESLLAVLKYDLHLMILKIGLNNFAAVLFSLLAKRYDQVIGISPALEQIYSQLFKSFGLELKLEDCQKIDTIVAVRQLCAELLRECDETNQGAYYLYLLASPTKRLRDCASDMQNSPSGKLVEEFSPKSYAIFLNLAIILVPVWHRNLFYFSSTLKTNKPFDSGFLTLCSELFTEEYKHIEEDLGEFLAALKFIESYEAQSPEETIQGLNFMALVISSISKASSPASLQNCMISPSPEINTREENQLINLKKGLKEIMKAAESAIEILGLFDNISSNPLLLSTIDHSCKKFLSTNFVEDFLDCPEECPQLKLIYFKFLERLAKETQGFPQLIQDSHIVTLGEISIFKDIILLKDYMQQRYRFIEEATIKKIPASSMIQLTHTDQTIEKLLVTILGKIEHLSFDFLEEIFPLLVNLNKLEAYMELLIHRFQYLSGAQGKLQLSIEQSKKILSKHLVEAAADGFKGDEWFSLGFYEREKLEIKEQLLLKLEAESKRVFVQILSILYDVSGIEKQTVEVFKLPGFLRNFKWISSLWDKIYCNKKTILTKTNLALLKDSSQKLSSIQKYLLAKNLEPKEVLVSFLKKIFNSNLAELRKSTMIWLMNEGKVALIDELDPNLSDELLTSSLCQIVESEGIISGEQAIDNQRFLIETLVKRKQTAPAIKLIRDFIDNSLITPQLQQIVSELTNCLISEDTQFSLFKIPSEKISALIRASTTLPVISTREKFDYIETALSLLSESKDEMVQNNKFQSVQYLKNRREACISQLNLLDELEIVRHKLQKIITIVQQAGADGSTLPELALVDFSSFRRVDFPIINSSLNQKVNQLELLVSILNVQLWDEEILLNRVANKFDLHKYLVQAVLKRNNMVTHDKKTIILGCIKEVVKTSSKLQTLEDVLYLALDHRRETPGTPNYMNQVISQCSKEALEDLWRCDLIWPNNAKNTLTAIMNQISQDNYLAIFNQEELAMAYLPACEEVNLRNPYMSLLLSNASIYLDINLAGAISVNRERPGAAPFVALLDNFSSFWTGDLLANSSKMFFKSYKGALGACFSIFENIIFESNEIQNQEKSTGNSQLLESRKDLLEHRTFRLIVIYSKVVVSLAEETATSKSRYQQEFEELHTKMIRNFNEMIAKINNSLILSPTLKSMAKHHVLRGRNQIELVRRSEPGFEHN